MGVSAMRELSGHGLAGGDAILDFDDASECQPGAESLLAAVLIWTIRLWCLPFLLLGWVITWTAIGLIRGTSCIAGAVRWLGKSPARRGTLVR